MSTPRRRGLQIDDPLGPTQPPQPAGRPTATDAPTASQPTANRPLDATDHNSKQGRRGEDPTRDRQDESPAPQSSPAGAPQPADGVAWRAWSGITGVGSFRLPHELLVELSDTARKLGLPIGLIVTAAITRLLDEPPEHIAVLVDRADDARIHGDGHDAD